MATSALRFTTVLVVDPHPMAHVPYIHAATLHCLISLGFQCVSLSVQSTAIQTEFEELCPRGKMTEANSSVVWGDLPMNAGSSWSALQASLSPWMHQHAIRSSAFIWIGWLDYLIGRSRKDPQLPSWSWFWAGAYYLLPSSFYTSGRFSKEWWKERLLPFWRYCASEHCHGVAVLDEYWIADAQSSVINRWFRPYHQKLIHFPDVASTHCSASCERSLRTGGAIRIGLFGQLSWRKGLLPFLRAARLSEQVKPHLEFHLAGELHLQTFSDADQKTVVQLLDNPPSNLHYRPGAISNEAEFNTLVKQSDIIHLAYHHFTGSSNLLTKAAHFRVPVIAYPDFLIGRRVHAFSLGLLATAETQHDYLDLVLSLSRETLSLVQADARYENYLASHDLSSMRRMFSRILGININQSTSQSSA